VNLASGSAEGRQQVNSANASAGDIVFDPSLDIEAWNVANVDRAYVVVDGTIGSSHALKRFKLPFCSDSGGALASDATAASILPTARR
jgi:hypothetical protein